MARKKALEKYKEDIKAHFKKVAEDMHNDDSDEEKFLNSKTLGLALEFYTVDESYKADVVLDKLIKRCEELDCLYAYILHDKDIYTDNTFDKSKKLLGRKGELKKAHYHFVVQFNYPSVIGDFILTTDIPIRFVKKLRNSGEVDNMLLYLSHIKYPNKYQYHKNGDIKGYIVTNRFDYIEWLHMSYKPKSAIKYAITYSQEHQGRYIRTGDYFLQADQDEISYDEFLKTYRVVKDILNEHNKEVEIVSPWFDSECAKMQTKVNKAQRHECDNDKRIRMLAETFGCTRVEFDGKEMLVVNLPQGKHLFEDEKQDDEKPVPLDLKAKKED